MATRAGHPHGISLPELLVVFFLLILALGMIAQMMVPATVLFQQQNAGAEAQLAAAAALHRIRDELLATSAATVTACDGSDDGPVAISLQPLVAVGQPFSLSGAPLFDDHFDIFWLDRAHHALWLMQRSPLSYGFGDNTKPQQLSQDDLADQAPDVAAGDRLLSNRVVALDMSTPQGVITYPLSLRMVVEVPDTRGRAERIELTTAVTPRNDPW